MIANDCDASDWWGFVDHCPERVMHDRMQIRVVIYKPVALCKYTLCVWQLFLFSLLASFMCNRLVNDLALTQQ